jgi:MFS transporter (putative signal transducer)
VLGGLYLAQAIPSYLFVAALPPIMRETGVSRTAIGYMSILLLPLVLKFIWAPWIDRIRPFARAHRAGWVFITQIGVIARHPGLIPVGATEVGWIIAVGFIASLLISTQDIATDGYAAKYLPEPIGRSAMRSRAARSPSASSSAARSGWCSIHYRLDRHAADDRGDLAGAADRRLR